MKIYSQVRLGLKPEINALSTILIVIVSVGVVTASIITKRATMKKRFYEQQANAQTS